MVENYSEICEEQEYEVLEAEESATIERYDIASYTIDKPIETLIKWKRNGKLIVPEFQREFVWNFNMASKLIDSILLNLPIPGIFVCRRIINNEEKYYLIDGLQRITTLEQFYNGTFISKDQNITKDFKISLKNSNWYKKSYKELTEADQENFKDFSISLTVFEITDRNEAKNLNSMHEIFERINTGSEKLTSQEIRNAIYSGELISKLSNEAKNTNFVNLIIKDKKMLKRKKDQELLLRFMTYYHVYKRFLNKSDYFINDGIKITTSKIETLNNYCYYSNENKIDYLKDFGIILDAIKSISLFDETSFYGAKRKELEISNTVHEIFSEALVIAVIENENKILISKDGFKQWKLDYWQSEEFYNYFVASTTSKENIIKRIEVLKKVINND